MFRILLDNVGGCVLYYCIPMVRSIRVLQPRGGGVSFDDDQMRNRKTEHNENRRNR